MIIFLTYPNLDMKVIRLIKNNFFFHFHPK